MDSHLAYGTYSLPTGFVKKKAQDESENVSIYSCNSKQSFEDLQTEPKIATVSNTEELAPRDADIVNRASKQDFEYLQTKPKINIASDMQNSSRRDAGLMNPEYLYSVKKEGKPLNSNTHQHSSPSNAGLLNLENSYSLRKERKTLNLNTDQRTSPRMCGNYVKTWKSPPKFRGTPLGELYASRFSLKVRSPSHQGQGESLPTNNSMYTSCFSDRAPSHSLQDQYYALSRGNFHGSKSTIQTANNDYKYHGVSNDMVRGPRASASKPTLSFPDKNSSYLYAQRDNFNKPDFEVNYGQAKFFMIKSFSEDDIHRSIKYSVWASTPNGNNKLDAAFKKAEMEQMEKGIPCPIFLFFSVNASGQFVGLAEMIGPIDFKKDMDFWQQNKWNGFFPVKWHIVKDIPNRIFHHITLENNYNRAVTYSRDTQEIYLPQGLTMLKIFKNYPIRTSILDDTEFYEKKEIEKEKSIPQHSEMDSGCCSMMHLESSFRNMSTSTRADKPHDTSVFSSTGFAKAQPFSNHS